MQKQIHKIINHYKTYFSSHNLAHINKLAQARNSSKRSPLKDVGTKQTARKGLCA